jgi:3-phosphoshikimate 1-carboxyvinyltransferase
MARIVEPLRAMGAHIDGRDDATRAPIVIRGGALRGIRYELPVASAQVKSCLVLAGLQADGLTEIVSPGASRDHTERMLGALGAPVTVDGFVVRVERGAPRPFELDVPGDPSSAAFLVAAGVLVPGSNLLLESVGTNWTRCGFLRILERMQAIVLADIEPLGAFDADEPVGDLDVRGGALEATTVESEEVPLAIDELPLVALLGCFAEGETVVRGAGELRLKESDRIATVVDGLRGLGADIEATPDGFAVRGGGGLRGGVLDAHGDHRLALLGAVAGLASREGVEVVGMEAAAVSYPGFADDVGRLLQ